jgi:hypothetical protein
MLPIAAMSAQFDIHGPPGSGAFGGSVQLLGNGNIVVADPEYDAGPIADVGAVHLYSPQGNLISTLVGSTAGDRVGSNVVIAASNYFLIGSPNWDNGALIDAGAVTIADAVTGITGAISTANSMLGSTAGDQVGSDIRSGPSPMGYFVVVRSWDNGAVADVGAVRWGNGSSVPTGAISASNSLIGSTAGDFDFYISSRPLSNGNYVMAFENWDNGAIVDAGAVTWIDRNNPPTGAISSANSLVGSSANDRVGIIYPLKNGNYVVGALNWDNGGIIDAGASIWADGTTGRTGTISSGNALVGSSPNDEVGGVHELANGNYLVRSYNWSNVSATRAGALTWVNGNAGIVGAVSAANSLVGTHTEDRIGINVRELHNGNYVTVSNGWHTSDLGAATWGNGQTGVSGVVSASNSLVGAAASDQVAFVTPLSNGNYVVGSPNWGPTDRGAITWANGATGKSGIVSSANSLIGGNDGDQLGFPIRALNNGHYVVSNALWDNGPIVDAGAVTWFDGTVEVTGVFTADASNSLVGTSTDDRVGGCPQFFCVYELAGGNYVVASSDWDNGAVTDAGAVTWGNGATGITGTVSSVNSVVGSSNGDHIGDVGSGTVRTLINHFAIHSAARDNGAAADAGAITWIDGSVGAAGPVSEFNSLVGSTTNDRVGIGYALLGLNIAVSVVAEDRYVVHSALWDNGGIVDAGAITIGALSMPAVGPITAANSVLGTAAGDGSRLQFRYDLARDRLVVGRPGSNIVTLFDFLIFADQFE